MNKDKKSSPASKSLRALFPGLCPPGRENYRRAFTEGLIVLDANALLDIYRFNEAGREEYLASLRLLGDRLWVPHRAAEEFLERRYAVITDSVAANGKFSVDLKQQLKKAEELIRETGKRRGLAPDQVKELVGLLDAAADQAAAKLAEFYSFPFSPEDALREDAILSTVEEILDGKLGDPLPADDFETAEKEAHRRIEKKIPPGYADAKKGDRAVGDYLIWLQTLRKAEDAKRPVLMISGEQKEDWVREDRGKKLGPHPKLVEEMRDFAGQEFHLVTVQSFLISAKEYLAAEVSETTVEQAAEEPSRSKPFSERFGSFLTVFVSVLAEYQAQQKRIANDPAYREEFERMRQELIVSRPLARYSAEQAWVAGQFFRTPEMGRYLALQGIDSSEAADADLADEAGQEDGTRGEDGADSGD